MKKLVSFVVLLMMLFVVAVGPVLANSNTSEIEKKIEKLDKQKNNILKDIKEQLKKQNRLEHYNIHKDILIVNMSILSTLPGEGIEPYGGEVPYKAKSTDYGWCDVHSSYLGPKDTETLLDEIAFDPYTTTGAVVVAIGGFLKNSPVGIAIGGAMLVANSVWTDYTRKQIRACDPHVAEQLWLQTQMVLGCSFHMMLGVSRKELGN